MSVTETIAALIAAKAKALVARDRDALDALIDPDFVYVTARGKRLDKTAYIDAFGGDGPVRFLAQDFDNLEIQEFGLFAVATMTLHDRIRYDGRDVASTFQSIAVFHETDAGWRWAAGQTMTAEG